MSSRFYNYLSEKIISYFKNNNPLSGDKFYVQFETEEQVVTLYKELKNNTIVEKFVYHDDKRAQTYESYQLKFGECFLIVAAAIEGGVHPDFLAQLRNMVGRDAGYENKAILFIHCSSLDSILGGAGSLSKEGMPLNIGLLKKDINRKIQETGFGRVDKHILLQYLKNKSNELEGTNESIFDYEDIIEVLGDSQITSSEYRTFELFPDENLEGLNEKKLIARLNDNHSHYVRISEIHNYGLDETRLEKYYGEDGAKRLAKDDWKDLTYPEIEKFIDNKKNKPVIEYFPIETNSFIWDREEGNTKAKSRIRNIIIFYNGIEDEYRLALPFSDFTRKDNVSINKGYEAQLECISTGKKLLVVLKRVLDQSSFYCVKYNDAGTRFEFKIAVLRCNQSLLGDIKTQYTIEIAKKPDESSIRINTEDDSIVFYPNNEQVNKEKLNESNQVIILDSSKKTIVSINDDFQNPDDSDDIKFAISDGTFDLNLTKAYVAERPIVIDGMKLWYLKNTRKRNFELVNENNLFFGTKRYFTRGEFRKTLQMERAFIHQSAPLVTITGENQYNAVKLELPEKVQSAFDALITYFQGKRKILLRCP